MPTPTPTLAPPCTRPRACLPDAELAPLLVYHPQGGIGNSLFGLSSAALLATAQCRRFAIAWGSNVNRQAGASFSALFQRPAGVAFLNESEGHELVSALNGSKVGIPGKPNACTLELNLHWNRSRSLLELLPDTSGVNAAACPVLHVHGNMYYAPVLERDMRVARAGRWLRARGLGCSGSSRAAGNSSKAALRAANSSSRAHLGRAANSSSSRPLAHLGRSKREAVEEPYFAAVSRHLFTPHDAASKRADEASTRKPREAVIGVHVRSTLLLALHKNGRDAACGKDLECKNILRTYGYLDCVAKVRNASVAAGFESTRIYVAADNAMVRKEALKVWGEDSVVPIPPYLFTGHEARGKMVTKRGALATTGAVDEAMLLARTDGLVVFDLKDSTYSAVAASWAAYGLGRHAGEGDDAGHSQQRPWLGVHNARHGCERIPDVLVDPPAPREVGGTVMERADKFPPSSVKGSA